MSAACSGCVLTYKPTMSFNFSTNRGSFDSLNVSMRCGLIPCSRQMRPIVDSLKPGTIATGRRGSEGVQTPTMRGRHPMSQIGTGRRIGRDRALAHAQRFRMVH